MAFGPVKSAAFDHLRKFRKKPAERLSEKARAVQQAYFDNRGKFGCHEQRLPKLLSALLGEEIVGHGVVPEKGVAAVHAEYGVVLITAVDPGDKTVKAKRRSGMTTSWLDSARLREPTEAEITALVDDLTEATLKEAIPGLEEMVAKS